MKSSDYINEQRKFYSLYVLQSRAIPLIADGLKAGARRVLWMARDGQKYKTATLAGKALPLHPHAPPEGAINTIAAPYGNNVTLFDGMGAFGTRLNPTAYGAARYTSVKVSQFTKDVIFRDIELVPMVENYDGTLEEPQFFLPLVPQIVLNPTEGIAIAFATHILPHELDDIIKLQIKVLNKQKTLPKIAPSFKGVKATAQSGTMFYFEGKVKRVNTTTIVITEFPYNTSHKGYIDFLDKLIDNQKIVDYEDNSKDVINIEVKFKRGQLAKYDSAQLLTLLRLSTRESENLTFIDVDCESVITDLSAEETISYFTEWRLTWYKKRYQRLLEEVQKEIQRYKDILTAIKKDVGGKSRKTNNRQKLIEMLEGFKIVNTEYIAGFPVYRFTVEEKVKVENKLIDATVREKRYKTLLKSEGKRRKVYIEELREILQRYKKGDYTIHQ